MEPIEINAGAWYLRALRADERVDDRPALQGGGITDPDYVARRRGQWATDEHCSWAVCEPTTGELLAEVGLTPNGSDGVLSGWARPGHEDALETATDSVRRFAEGALGLTVSRT
ncbi:hypothetical protein ERC79_04990 [Rhodococcus sp. ABRD24]|uniref:hypothetical protein n=1 Tax=Rhodococcus sp. ABRD24 TaxID=2507582 RepID=UPI00103EAAEA|nr:hypothetical protein [Rhodococcus sp. ABRD24]QBJ95382.1 hypothetical protein ERC79_04990 [Rhodococcus sp. ABRD24]